MGASGPAYLAALSSVLLRTWPMNTSSTRIGGRSGSTWMSTVRPPRLAACPTHRLGHDVTHGEDEQARVEFACLDPAHVEQVRDESIEPIGLAVDRRRDRSPLVRRPIDGRVHQRPRGGPDRRQRRAQVVRDRVEQRGLQRVAPSRHLGRRGIAGEPIALERPAELVRCRREDPRLARIGVAQRSGASAPQRPELPLPRRDADPIRDDLAVATADRGQTRARGREPTPQVRRRGDGGARGGRAAPSQSRPRDPCRQPRSLRARSTPATCACRRGPSPRPRAERPEHHAGWRSRS